MPVAEESTHQRGRHIGGDLVVDPEAVRRRQRDRERQPARPGDQVGRLVGVSAVRQRAGQGVGVGQRPEAELAGDVLPAVLPPRRGRRAPAADHHHPPGGEVAQDQVLQVGGEGLGLLPGVEHDQGARRRAQVVEHRLQPPRLLGEVACLDDPARPSGSVGPPDQLAEQRALPDATRSRGGARCSAPAPRRAGPPAGPARPADPRTGPRQRSRGARRSSRPRPPLLPWSSSLAPVGTVVGRIRDCTTARARPIIQGRGRTTRAHRGGRTWLEGGCVQEPWPACSGGRRLAAPEAVGVASTTRNRRSEPAPSASPSAAAPTIPG